jgi:hypothetical protein
LFLDKISRILFLECPWLAYRSKPGRIEWTFLRQPFIRTGEKMDSKATAQALLDAVEMGDFQKAQSYLSDDFQFSGPVPEPQSGPAWLGMSAGLKKAFPDLNYHFNIESVDGDAVNISAELKGTHLGDLDLTPMGMSLIPPTNKSFATAHEHGKLIVKDGKVREWAVEPREGAGLMSILGQLGIKLPTM